MAKSPMQEAIVVLHRSQSAIGCPMEGSQMLRTISNPLVLRDVKQQIDPLSEARKRIVAELDKLGAPIDGPTMFPARLDDVDVEDCRAIVLRRKLHRVKRKLTPLTKIAAFTARTLRGD